MIYIACFVIAFAVLQLFIAFVNMLIRPSLKNQSSGFDALISVMIPARNEENNIIKLLTDLQHQTYKNIEILVFNDQSTDRTAELVNEMTLYDKRIRLINSDGLPENWLGKNFACHSAAQPAKGDFFLFLDADVRLNENAVSRSIAYMRESKVSLMSVFPKQTMLSYGEKRVVPLMNYILLTLLPLFLVRFSKTPSLSAANGQFMLFEAEAYKQIKPHAVLKAEKVEDIRIAQLFKKLKFRMACLTGSDDINCRMYQSYEDALNGFSKNVTMFFGNSYVLALLFWLITTWGFIPVLTALPALWFWLLTLIVLLTRVFVSVASRQQIVSNLILIIPQQLSLGIIIFKSLQYKIRGNYEWKGRKI